jgi:hypothetical protein
MLLTLLYLAAGAHTIGLARCTNFRAHVYNDTNIDASFAKTRRPGCPGTSGSGDNNLAPLDLQTPTVFENNYYDNLVCKKGLLHSDQELFNGGATDAQVRSYASKPDRLLCRLCDGHDQDGRRYATDRLQWADQEELQKG